MPSTDVSAYPWQSRAVFAAELDADGVVLAANGALVEASGGELEGAPFADLLAAEQRASFHLRLADLGSDWAQATFGFFNGGPGSAQDRRVWLRRRADGSVDVIAEPAWREHDRLVEQVLQLNDDLISTQRSLGRRQRELERAQDEAAASARRVGQLEAIVLAGLIPVDFDEALRSLLSTAQQLLPGERADILLLDDTGTRLVVRATLGPGGTTQGGVVPVGESVLGMIAANGTSTLVEDLTISGDAVEPGSLIGVPLRVDGQVIGVLSVSAAGAACFSDPDLRLLELVGERMALAIGQAQVREREQRMAETLQRSLLPQSLPRLTGVELAAVYRPRTGSVGGDFYDAIAFPDGTLGLAIGDVTGKGLRAAAAMGRVRSALHAYALDSASPAEVLDRLDRLTVADRAMATALYLVLHPDTGRVELASAGHLPPLCIEGEEASLLEIGQALSPPLGLTVERRRQITLELPVGATLLLYTDGLVERTRDIDRGLADLRRAAASLAGAPAETLCERLLNDLAPSGRYLDDVALIALRRVPRS